MNDVMSVVEAIYRTCSFVRNLSASTTETALFRATKNSVINGTVFNYIALLSCWERIFATFHKNPKTVFNL